MVALIIGGAFILGLLFLVYVRQFTLSNKLSRCEALLKEGRAAQALTALKPLVAKQAKEIKLRHLLARIRMALGDYREAVKEWNLVLLLNARDREYQNASLAAHLADSQMALNEWREAQGGLLVALKTSPVDTGLIERLALVYLKRGMAKHSVACYRTLVRLEGEDLTNLTKLATAQEIAGDLRAALETTLHLLKLDPQNGPANQMAARLYQGFNNHQAAEGYWRNLSRRSDYRKEALWGLAICLESQVGRQNQAVETWLSALEHAENKDERVEILYRMAGLLLQLEDITRALLLLREVLGLKPGYKETESLLEQYALLEESSELGGFARGSLEEFRPLAYRLVETLGFLVTKEITVQKRHLLFYGTIETHGKRETVLAYFSRRLVALGERELREIQDELRLMRGRHAWVFSVPGFSEPARDFAKARELSLVDHDEIKRILDVGRLTGAEARQEAINLSTGLVYGFS